MASSSPVKVSTKTTPEISVNIVARKSSYSYKDTIVLECIIENSTPDEIVLLWDRPTYKLWIPEGLSIHSYGWQSSPTLVVVKPKTIVTKALQFSQNKDIPYLARGNLDVTVDFNFPNHDPRIIRDSVVIKFSDEAQIGLQKRMLISAAQKLSEKDQTEIVIDYRSGHITDHLNRGKWTVSFSNEGPEMFGVTQINVHKKTGVASWPRLH